MGGFFGVASKKNCTLELFYGVDYHSHLGTRRGGMAMYGKEGFQRAIHNIENSPFRTKFEKDAEELDGHLGIGCISDYEPQPLLIQSHLGSFAITTVGKVNNLEELLRETYDAGRSHFQEMSGGQINATELIASLICKSDTLVEGIRYVQELVDGSMTILLMTKDGIYAARDRYGRTPVVLGKREDGYCISFENFAYINLGFEHYKELQPAEIVFVTPESVETVGAPGTEMKMCSFLWVYYGYPTSSYEGVNVEEMRYTCGSMLAKRDSDSVSPDIVAGVGDRACHRVCQRIRDSVCKAIYQVHTYLAQILYACEPEPERSDRPDEADPRAGADQGEKAASDRRLYRAGNPASGNHGIFIPERGKGGSCPPGVPAAAVRMQVSEFFTLQVGSGSDHKTGDPGTGGGSHSGGALRVFGSVQREI